MITVINNFNESTEMYDGTLQEAASQFVLEANQLVNDFSMDLLLTEHKYLFEHGEQLDWVTEADENGGLKFVNKVKDFFSGFAELFKKIYNNIVAWINEHIGKMITFFKSIQHDEAGIRKAFGKANTTYNVPAFMVNKAGSMEISGNVIRYFSDEAVKKFSQDDDEASIRQKLSKNEFITRSNQFYEELDKKGVFASIKVESGSAEAKTIEDNVVEFIFKSNKYVNEAKRVYNDAVNNLESLKKRVSQNKSREADDISETSRFEKQMAFLEKNPEIDVVGGAINEINEEGNSRGKTIIYPTTPEGCKAFFC